MTHFSDGVSVGSAGASGSDARLLPGVTGFGVPLSNGFVYDVVPTTIVTTAVAAAQAVAGAANLTLNGTLATAGVVTFDVPRCATVLSTNAGDTAQTATFYGTDAYGVALTNTVTLNGTSTVITTKAFKTITRVAISAVTVGNISSGNSDTLGLPYRVDAYEYLAPIVYNATVVTASTGFTAAVTTSPATATTGDVRGTYALQTASNGSRRFVARIYSANANTSTGLYGVAQV